MSLADMSRKYKVFFPKICFRKKENNYTSGHLLLLKSHKESIICPKIKVVVNCQLEIRTLKNNKKYYLDGLKGRWIILQGGLKIVTTCRTPLFKMSAAQDSTIPLKYPLL
jgi:hypothetical protein